MRVRSLIGNWNTLLAVLTAVCGVTCVVNYDALAHGKTTNDSVFTDEQATRGEDAYQQECAQCHLDDLLGDGIAPSLIAAPFSFRWSELSFADMLVAIRTTMPQGAPASLSPQAYVDIVAYMLKVNDYPAGDVELPTAEAELEAIIIADSQ